MRKESLAIRQFKMRLRNEAKPRVGRPRKKKPSERFRLQRRIATRVFVLRGWSTEKIANHFNDLFPDFHVDPAEVQRWIRAGMPLVDKQARRIFSQSVREQPEYR